MKPLKEKQVKALCQAADYENGQDYFRQGKVSDTWQAEDSLHASVAGSGKKPYQVSITAEGDELIPKCTCPAHRRRPFCKHVVAVLVAWTQAPERFRAGRAPVALKPQSQARRAPRPKVDRQQIQAEGLDKVEELLVELANYGLLSLTEAQVTRVDDLAHTVESHKLRRLARQIGLLGTMLATARTNQQGFDEKRYAELLSDAWLTAQATRRTLQDPDADPTALEELVGKTWREKDLERREGVRLLELAFESVELDTGFRVDTSFLLSLDDGALYTEKLIVPYRLKNQPRKPCFEGLIEGTVGLYPGLEPRRIKLIEMTPERPPADTDWQQALVHARPLVAALYRHFQTVTANPLAQPEALALVAPARIFVDGPHVHLLDESGEALPLAEGWRVLGWLIHKPVAAVFGRLKPGGTELHLTPLSLVTAPPGSERIRLGGWLG
jgi:hypothetical protein